MKKYRVKQVTSKNGETVFIPQYRGILPIWYGFYYGHSPFAPSSIKKDTYEEAKKIIDKFIE